MAVGNTNEQRETGNRMIGWGGPFSGLGSRPSGIRFGCSRSGSGSGNLPSVICHRPSHPIQVAGGGLFHSALCHLSSIQPSIQQRYVVTRSRPCPRQTRSARGPDPAQGKLGQHAVLALPRVMHYPYTRYSILDTLFIPPPPSVRGGAGTGRGSCRRRRR